MDRPPVHELSAVNGHSLRFNYRSTVVLTVATPGVGRGRESDEERLYEYLPEVLAIEYVFQCFSITFLLISLRL
jgi:hypothetical protein